MPILSMFYGIVVRIYNEKGGRHSAPHIHVEYQGDEVVVGILDGKELEGHIPSNKMKLLQAWMEIHRDELIANWKLISEGNEIYKIDPLK